MYGGLYVVVHRLVFSSVNSIEKFMLTLTECAVKEPCFADPKNVELLSDVETCVIRNCLL